MVVLLRRMPRELWVLTLGWLVNACAYSMVMPFLAIFLTKKMAAGERDMSYVLLTMGLAGVVAPPLSGMLADRFGRRRLLFLAPAVRALVYVALAGAVHARASLVVLSALLAAANLLGAFYQSVADAYVADLVPPESRAEAYSVMRVGLNVGFMMGPAIGAFLSRTPWSLLFGITAVLVASNAILMYVSCRESMPAPASPAASRMDLAVCFRNRPFLGHCAMAVLFFLCTSQLVTTLSLDALKRVSLTENQIGLLYTLNGAVVILFQVPTSRAFRGITLRRRLAEGVLLYGFAFWSLAAANSFGGMLACVALISAGEIIAYPAIVSVATSLAPPEAMGRHLGVYTMARGIAYSLGPYLGMQYYAIIGGRPLAYWAIFGGFAALAGVGFALLPGGGTIRSAAMSKPDDAKDSNGASPQEPA
jgi:predicted MFS family arabinose efflux permease